MEENSPSDSSTCEENLYTERLEPLGACNEKEIIETPKVLCDTEEYYRDKLIVLEEEQELLNSALFALITHFAQVQFRLRQILKTPLENRDSLLASLEEFAENGLPDIKLLRNRKNDLELQEDLIDCRSSQAKQIRKLKQILKDLEYQVNLLDKEDNVDEDIIEIKSHLNYQYVKFTKENLTIKQEFDENRLFVEQLKTQVRDLEQFVTFLKDKSSQDACACRTYFIQEKSMGRISKLTKEIFVILQFLAMFHMTFLSYIGKRKPKMRNVPKTNHWGELRAKFEIAIYTLLDLLTPQKRNRRKEKYLENREIILFVRKNFAACLKNLMEHGIKNTTYSIVPLTCFKSKKQNKVNEVNAWCVLLKYAEYINRKSTTSVIAKTLYKSYNLQIDNLSETFKQRMISTIEEIISSHVKYKRSIDSQFKAFVCAGLNANMLTLWLESMFQCDHVINQFYYPWSYAAKTKFQDSIRSMEKLSKFKFNLPVDIAIHNFDKYDDAFI